jgi:hypothetical protein
MIEIMSDTMTNAQIVEFLAVVLASAEGNKLKALRRASRFAYAWPVEASELLRTDDPSRSFPASAPGSPVALRVSPRTRPRHPRLRQSETDS